MKIQINEHLRHTREKQWLTGSLFGWWWTVKLDFKCASVFDRGSKRGPPQAVQKHPGTWSFSGRCLFDSFSVPLLSFFVIAGNSDKTNRQTKWRNFSTATIGAESNCRKKLETNIAGKSLSKNWGTKICYNEVGARFFLSHPPRAGEGDPADTFRFRSIPPPTPIVSPNLERIRGSPPSYQT